FYQYLEMPRIRFQRLLRQNLMPVIPKTHRYVLDRIARVQPDFQSLAGVHHLQLQLGLDVVERAHHAPEIEDRRAGRLADGCPGRCDGELLLGLCESGRWLVSSLGLSRLA